MNAVECVREIIGALEIAPDATYDEVVATVREVVDAWQIERGNAATSATAEDVARTVCGVERDAARDQLAALAAAVLAEREARKQVEIDVCIRDRHAMMPSDLPTGLARHMGWHTDQRELADRVVTSMRSHAAALTHLNALIAGCPS